MSLAFLGIPHYFWHPYSGNGYQFWSGIGSDIGEVAIVGGLVTLLLAFWRHFNCHADRCWRLSWHTHADHGHPLCRVHHPHGKNRAHTIGGVNRAIPVEEG